MHSCQWTIACTCNVTCVVCVQQLTRPDSLFHAHATAQVTQQLFVMLWTTMPRCVEVATAQCAHIFTVQGNSCLDECVIVNQKSYLVRIMRLPVCSCVHFSRCVWFTMSVPICSSTSSHTQTGAVLMTYMPGKLACFCVARMHQIMEDDARTTELKTCTVARRVHDFSAGTSHCDMLQDALMPMYHVAHVLFCRDASWCLVVWTNHPRPAQSSASMPSTGNCVSTVRKWHDSHGH